MQFWMLLNIIVERLVYEYFSHAFHSEMRRRLLPEATVSTLHYTMEVILYPELYLT